MSTTQDETASAIPGTSTEDSMPDNVDVTPHEKPLVNEVETEPMIVDDEPPAPSTEEEQTENKSIADEEKSEEVEEGELPEDGEIMDDDDDASQQIHAVETDVHTAQPTAENRANTETQHSAMDTSEEVGRRAPHQDHDDYRSANRSPSDAAGYQPAPTLPPRRRQPWTEGVLCKFYREGFCRDGEQCAYSHNAAHSNRKPELCKFYQQGFCKKGLACTLLHGEYPCKEFHNTGQCTNKQCKYSHVPLNEYTRSIFQRMLQDEALAAQIVIPEQPQRRRVLLKRPPPAAAPPAVVTPAAPSQPPAQLYSAYSTPTDTPHHELTPHYDRTPQTTHLVTEPISTDVLQSTPIDSGAVGSTTPDLAASTTPANETATAPPPVNNDVLSLDALLDEIATSGDNSHAAVQGENVPPTEAVLDEIEAAAEPQPAKVRQYRLIPLAPTTTVYDIAFLKKINSDKLKKDPRIKSLVQKQFDEASNMFDANMPKPPTPPEKKKATTRKPGRDPRGPAPVDSKKPVPQKPAVEPELLAVPTAIEFDVHSGLPATSITTNAGGIRSMDDHELKSMIEKQLQMVKEYGIVPTDMDPHSYHSAPQYPEESYSQPYDSGYDRYDEGGYNDGGYDYPVYENEYRGHYQPRGRGSRGYGDDRAYRSGARSGRNDSRWERYGPREPPHYRERDRREFRASNRSHRNRSRSRSPRPSRPDMAMRDKRKSEYHSPLARA